jgi:hypothetical protein
MKERLIGYKDVRASIMRTTTVEQLSKLAIFM